MDTPTTPFALVGAIVVYAVTPLLMLDQAGDFITHLLSIAVPRLAERGLYCRRAEPDSTRPDWAEPGTGGAQANGAGAGAGGVSETPSAAPTSASDADECDGRFARAFTSAVLAFESAFDAFNSHFWWRLPADCTLTHLHGSPLTYSSRYRVATIAAVAVYVRARLSLVRKDRDVAERVARGEANPRPPPADSTAADEAICRICFAGADAGRLVSPCLCSGSMRFVHLDCLSEWRRRSANPKSHYQCDNCLYRYSFRRAHYALVLRSALVGCRPS